MSGRNDCGCSVLTQAALPVAGSSRSRIVFAYRCPVGCYGQAMVGCTVRLKAFAASAARPQSDRETGATLGAAARQDFAAVCGCHAGTEAMITFALDVAGLVGDRKSTRLNSSH